MLDPLPHGPSLTDALRGSGDPQSSLRILSVKPSRTWARPSARLREALLLPPRPLVSRDTRTHQSGRTGRVSPSRPAAVPDSPWGPTSVRSPLSCARESLGPGPDRSPPRPHLEPLGLPVPPPLPDLASFPSDQGPKLRQSPEARFTGRTPPVATLPGGPPGPGRGRARGAGPERRRVAPTVLRLPPEPAPGRARARPSGDPCPWSWAPAGGAQRDDAVPARGVSGLPAWATWLLGVPPLCAPSRVGLPARLAWPDRDPASHTRRSRRLPRLRGGSRRSSHPDPIGRGPLGLTARRADMGSGVGYVGAGEGSGQAGGPPVLPGLLTWTPPGKVGAPPPAPR